MPDRTKERIIEAAYRALVKRGYHETSMKDIAAEAGVAPGLAHYYFESKEDLLVAVIEHACAPAIDAWEQAGMSLNGPLPENADPMAFARTGFALAKQVAEIGCDKDQIKVLIPVKHPAQKAVAK